MNIRRKQSATMLSENDRKVLDKYTKFYTNFIESNTAQTDVLGHERFKPKPKA